MCGVGEEASDVGAGESGEFCVVFFSLRISSESRELATAALEELGRLVCRAGDWSTLVIVLSTSQHLSFLLSSLSSSSNSRK